MAHLKPGYEPVAQQEHLTDAAQPQRSWHGSLLNCLGLGLGDTSLGVYTAFVTHYLPCVTFGTSHRRAFGHPSRPIWSALRPALIIFYLMMLSWAHYASQAALFANECVVPPPARHAHHQHHRHGIHDVHSGSHMHKEGPFKEGPFHGGPKAPRQFGPSFDLRFFEVNADGMVTKLHAHPAPKSMLTHAKWRCAKLFGARLDASRPEASPVCERLASVGLSLNLWTIAYFLLVVFYGAAQRTQMRQRFGIEGSRMGDFCTWFWCMQCALCQESRTMTVNNVENGVWQGREHTGLPVVAAADVAEAPIVPVMSTGAVPIKGSGQQTGSEGLSKAEKAAAAAKL
mmetsp:Transcript_21205/g.63812  ORF Transcript_21205/g.63812 Transcript_21205/m.63812 type:complete len:342 (+) Transcript_21205:254-1279(+)|eukprot:CAMPEP_0206148242 /NCGR_PEP_ID=MMETSP1473-20131121/36012_1 /ASSEMBLY_ACC=CAM_ASM_001109 /TAXON_ID=1461547 /ORGANISM="Stichococcus sp, Strain RCC1054" /LENGTH=341 /DNA_ID=CAMNT_0053545505 /DNA_START=216 /DNA_END=1241 /DNA_ORIENTATION=+